MENIDQSRRTPAHFRASVRLPLNLCEDNVLLLSDVVFGKIDRWINLSKHSIDQPPQTLRDTQLAPDSQRGKVEHYIIQLGVPNLSIVYHTGNTFAGTTSAWYRPRDNLGRQWYSVTP